MQGRPDGVFKRVAAPKAPAACLRTVDAPHHVRLATGAHLRSVSATTLARAVQPFIAAAAQRDALLTWTRAITHTAGRGSSDLPLPAELLTEHRLNPTISALAVAVSQQLDVVAAATQDLQEWLDAQIELAQAGEPLLLWLTALCRPVLARLDFLHTAFAAAVSSALAAGRTGAPPSPRGPRPRPTSLGERERNERQAHVSKAAIDSVHRALLQVEKLPGRCASSVRDDGVRLPGTC